MTEQKRTSRWTRVNWTTIRRFSHEASETLLAVLADATPWLVGLMPAAAIARGLSNAGVEWWLVVVVAVGVELTALLAGYTLTEAREAGRDTKRIWIALGVYVAVGVMLAVLLDVWPSVTKWALVEHNIVLPDLRSIWAAVLAPLVVMAYWLRSERAVIRAEHPLYAANPEPVNDEPEPAPTNKLTLEDYLVQFQPVRMEDVAAYFGISRTTAYNRVSDLMQRGIITKNGHGYELKGEE